MNGKEIKKEVAKLTPQQAGKMLEFLRKLDTAYTEAGKPEDAQKVQEHIKIAEGYTDKL